MFDPRTLRPAESGCRAVWVIAPTCTEAGALATAAFVAGPDEGTAMVEASHHAAACFWTDRGVTQTRRFERYVIRD
jgi:thiamine biosynthesis lipoprotein